MICESWGLVVSTWPIIVNSKKVSDENDEGIEYVDLPGEDGKLLSWKPLLAPLARVSFYPACNR